ncbi:MAG: phosphonate C-P lyase system protein PhnG [Pseudomonadota bacterium]
MTSFRSGPEPRKTWMGILAKADAELLDDLWSKAALDRAFTWLRAPETGSVMVQGRMGGSGGAFNLGEITVTRCSLQIDCGTVGHAYVQGRTKAKAEKAALCDALMQTEAASQVEAAILTPLAARQAETAQTRAAKAAATKVDFFTMVRGED